MFSSKLELLAALCVFVSSGNQAAVLQLSVYYLTTVTQKAVQMSWLTSSLKNAYHAGSEIRFLDSAEMG